MLLVVGGAGYIGSHMAKLLRHVGMGHIVADNLEQGHADAVRQSMLEKVDLRDPASLEAVFQKYEISGVLMFAAYISVGESMREPEKYFKNNIIGCLNLLEAMRKSKARRIIFSSTAAVYGEPREIPIPEEHRLEPTNPYGESKLAMEKMLQWYVECHDFQAVSLRYFNAAGADPEGELGEDHHPEEHLIPVAIEAAMGQRDKLVIYGDDYDTPDGTCIRDYIHVMDLAEAHLRALESFEHGPAAANRAYNLGSGAGYTVKQVVDMVARVSGKEVPHEIGPRRPGDPARLVASSHKIKKELSWEPKYDDLETIVRHAWDWKQAHPKGYGG